MHDLAKVSSDRFISVCNARNVHLTWDGIMASWPRDAFMQVVRVLESARNALYAAEKNCSVVHAEADTFEIWFWDACLRMSQAEYRAMLNAFLIAETRLHGLPRTQDEVSADVVHIQLVRTIRPPREICHALN